MPGRLTTKTPHMKRRTILLSVAGIVLAAGAYYGYKLYYRENKDLTQVKPALVITADKLVQEFVTDETAANKKYLPKEELVIEVTGEVKSVETNDKGRATLVLKASEADMSSLQCSIDSTHLGDLNGIKPGDAARVRGVVTGFNSDELLGSDVFLARSVVIRQ